MGISRSLTLRRKQLTWGLLAGCVFAYSLFFILPGPLYGTPVMVLSVLPVVFAAALRGRRAAGFTSLAGIALALALAALQGQAALSRLVTSSWPLFIITSIVALFVGRMRDLQQAHERIQRRLQTLNQINQAITRGGSPEALGREVVAQLCALLACERATIFVYDPDSSQCVRVLAAYSRAAGHLDLSSDAPLKVGDLLALPDAQWPGCPLRAAGSDACLTYCGQAMQSAISEPLKARASVIGSLALCAAEPGHFREEEYEVIREIAAQLAVTIENGQLHASQQRYVAELEALRVATLQITASLDLEHVLGSILQYALNIIHADDAHIFLYDGEQLTFGAAIWDGVLKDAPLMHPRKGGITMRVAETKERIVISDATTHPIYANTIFNGAIVATPLLVSGRVEGVMSMAYIAPHDFNAHELRVLELFADHAALAIFNAKLVERIQEQNEALEERVIERTAALQDLNQSVEAILDNSSDAILLLSAHTGAVERNNTTAMRWFDIKAEDVQASWRSFIVDESQAVLSACFARVVATGQPERQEVVIRTATGEVLDADVAMTLDQGEGRQSRVICSLRDITARKRAIATNQRLVDGLRAVVSSAYDLLACQTLDELYFQAVSTARARLGLERCGLFVPRDENFWGTYGTDRHGHLIEERDNYFAMTDPLWLPRLEQLRSSSSQWITVTQTLVEWRDGQTATFGVDGWVAVTPLRTPQGLVGILFNDSGLTGNALDPTQQELVFLFSSLLAHILTRRQLEDDLRLALHKERELNELKSRFVSMVSHEFRTPLAIIQSSGDMLKYYSERMTEDRRKEKLEIIQEQIRHLTGMLEDILAISRAESIGLELNRVPLDLTSMCSAIISEFEGTTRHRKLTLKVVGQPRRIPLDPKLIRQAISNLVSNAIKYSPEHAPVDLELIYASSQVSLAVTDYGIGIPDDERERIFEIFHRAGNVDQIAGTGLGLAIVKHVVDLHEGTIDCASEVGQGTTFRLSLPIVS